MTNQSRDATLYRMVMKNHLCPFGLKSLDLLKREGFRVDSQRGFTRAISGCRSVLPALLRAHCRVNALAGLPELLARGIDRRPTLSILCGLGDIANARLVAYPLR